LVAPKILGQLGILDYRYHSIGTVNAETVGVFLGKLSPALQYLRNSGFQRIGAR